MIQNLLQTDALLYRFFLENFFLDVAFVDGQNRRFEWQHPVVQSAKKLAHKMSNSDPPYNLPPIAPTLPSIQSIDPSNESQQLENREQLQGYNPPM
jgi:hypothetical protein